MSYMDGSANDRADSGATLRQLEEDGRVTARCNDVADYCILWRTPQGEVRFRQFTMTASERMRLTDGLDRQNCMWIVCREGRNGLEWAYSTENEETRSLLRLLMAGYLNPLVVKPRYAPPVLDQLELGACMARHPAGKGRQTN